MVDEQKDPVTFSDPRPAGLGHIRCRHRLALRHPAAGDVGPTQYIEITVSDGKDTSPVGPFQITVQARHAAPPLTMRRRSAATPRASSSPCRPYIFLPTGADADTGDNLTYSISGKPSWLQLDPEHRAALRHAASHADRHVRATSVLSVSDGKAMTSLPAFPITVQPAAVVIEGTPATTVTAGTAYSFKPTGQGSELRGVHLDDREPASVGELQQDHRRAHRHAARTPV